MRKLITGLPPNNMTKNLAHLKAYKGYAVYIDNFGWYCDMLITDEIDIAKRQVKVRTIEPNLG